MRESLMIEQLSVSPNEKNQPSYEEFFVFYVLYQPALIASLDAKNASQIKKIMVIY